MEGERSHRFAAAITFAVDTDAGIRTKLTLS
jgi:hypothetical protein